MYPLRVFSRWSRERTTIPARWRDAITHNRPVSRSKADGRSTPDKGWTTTMTLHSSPCQRSGVSTRTRPRSWLGRARSRAVFIDRCVAHKPISTGVSFRRPSSSTTSVSRVSRLFTISAASFATSLSLSVHLNTTITRLRKSPEVKIVEGSHQTRRVMWKASCSRK